MSATIGKAELTGLLYQFLDAIYLFQRKEEGLFDATWQDIFLLKRLSDSGGLTVGQAAAELRMPLFGASRLASRLEEKGLAAKRRDPGNRRLVRIAATAAGKRLLGRVEDFQRELLGRNLGILGETEVESLAAAIRKLRALLEID